MRRGDDEDAAGKIAAADRVVHEPVERGGGVGRKACGDGERSVGARGGSAGDERAGENGGEETVHAPV
ncbi:hypothetical protein WPS_03620 [Vulcanimicrobium alpinum]|uniref:Uncharacterized protein n=1 Tax=Vulcanimicrobium alpinum TaxID=3016050 RepID=A0AAN1XSR4_UNVUL|nr:hypothetical protein WPS_03620 [Vulcanimicrobium alpinum]